MNRKSARLIGLAAAIGCVCALLDLLLPFGRDCRAQSGGADSHNGMDALSPPELAEVAAIRASIAAISPRTAPADLAGIEKRLAEFDAEIAERSPLPVGHLHHAFGQALYAASRFEMSIAAARRAETLLEAQADYGCAAGAAMLESGGLSGLGRPDEALAILDRWHAVATLRGMSKLLVRIEVNRSLSLSDTGRKAESARCAESAVAAAREAGDREVLAQALFNRGANLVNRGRARDGLADFDDALAAYRDLGNAERVRAVRSLRADALVSLGRYSEALAALEDLLAESVAAGDEVDVARRLSSRGALWRALGRYEESAADHRRAAAAFEARSMRPWAAREHEALASSLNNAGRYAEALAACDRAEALMHGGSRLAGDLFERRAFALYRLDRFDEALEAIDRAAAEFESSGALVNRAVAVARRGYWLSRRGRAVEGLAAIDSVADFLADSDNPARVNNLSYWRSGALLEAGRPREAFAEVARGWTAFQNAYAFGVRSLGERGSVFFRAEWAQSAHRAIHCLAAMPVDERAAALEDAYAIFQGFNGVALAEALGAPGGSTPSEIPSDLEVEWYDAERRVVEIRKRRAALLDAEAPAGGLREASRRESELATATDELRSAETARLLLAERIRARLPAAVPDAVSRSATLDEVRAALPKGAALLEFASDANRTLAFVVTPSGASVADLGDTQPISAAATALFEKMRDPSVAAESLRAPLEELGRLVLLPCLSAIPEAARVERLLIAASGDLCRVPFEALLRSAAPPDAPVEEWPFLVATHAVAYVHSGGVLRDVSRRPPRPPGPARFVALAHPLYRSAAVPGAATALRGGSLEPLPATADEALAIARLFASEAEATRLSDAASASARGAIPESGLEVEGERFRVLLRGAAREAALKRRPELRDAAILHLACHGFADTRSPALCHVALSAEETAPGGEDGFLSLVELRDLGVRADLVTLSACETNAGNVMQFEGIAGLSRAALAGGAASVLSTLWRVRDAESRDLVVGFYRAWIADGAPKIEALARAKRDAIRRGASIPTWAGFTLWDAGR